VNVLGRAVSIIERTIRGASRIAAVVGLGILVCMALFTLADVIGRSGFNKPITGSYELTELAFVVVVACVLGYSVILKSHVKIDLLVSHFTPRAQATIDTISSLISSALFFLVGWRVFIQAARIKGQGLNSGILEVPVFPFYYVLAIGCTLFGAMLLIGFFRSFSNNTGDGKTDK
jgi:TRAP-type C4-dicarboxylate transport system permease small subunit